jgi:hypothetical protein
MKTRETEYRGIVFRSKCEAQVALSLDICPFSVPMGRKWWYEPNFLAIEDYVPDFLIHELEFYEGECIHHWKIVECKPSTTTDTYKRELASRFSKIEGNAFVQSIRAAYGERAISFQLWEGSVYVGVTVAWQFVGYGDHIPANIKQPFCDSIAGDWLDSDLVEQIKLHRFDLLS